MKLTKCKDIRPKISDYIDSALASDEMWAVQLHMSVCPECAQFAASISKTVNALKQLPATTPSANFDRSLASRIQAAIAAGKTRASAPWLVRTCRGFASKLSPKSATSGTGLRLSAPIALATALIGVLALMNQPNPPSLTVAPRATVDAGFTAACVHQNQTYVSGQPFADQSALALLQRQTDEGIQHASNGLLGSGKI